jgi:hypothetical protein
MYLVGGVFVEAAHSMQAVISVMQNAVGAELLPAAAECAGGIIPCHMELQPPIG